MSDPFNLERFKQAQDTVYHRVISELSNGRKTSHWMWFIFPQIAGLGQSAMARKYEISNVGEARAYLQQPLLAGRLIECCELILVNQGKSITDIMGHPDDIKLKSSMTLFHHTAPEQSIFEQVIGRYYQGNFDQTTLKILNT